MKRLQDTYWWNEEQDNELLDQGFDEADWRWRQQLAAPRDRRVPALIPSSE